MKILHHALPLVAVTALLAAVIGVALATSEPARAADKPAAQAVARGKYLVETGGCGDCHTPLKMGPNGPEPDQSRALSGHPEALQMPPAPALPEGPWLVVSSATNTAWAGPWGVSFSANLTPDAQTGLGGWTQRDFVQTIRTGRHVAKGRPLLPPMPVPAYNNFSDADLAAIYAYLRTVPAVNNRVPQPRPPVTAGAS
jgi:mono/diheme cytochrome c family protein